jgi:hypothetical protein
MFFKSRFVAVTHIFILCGNDAEIQIKVTILPLLRMDGNLHCMCWQLVFIKSLPPTDTLGEKDQTFNSAGLLPCVLDAELQLASFTSNLVAPIAFKNQQKRREALISLSPSSVCNA